MKIAVFAMLAAKVSLITMIGCACVQAAAYADPVAPSRQGTARETQVAAQFQQPAQKSTNQKPMTSLAEIAAMYTLMNLNWSLAYSGGGLPSGADKQYLPKTKEQAQVMVDDWLKKSDHAEAMPLTYKFAAENSAKIKDMVAAADITSEDALRFIGNNVFPPFIYADDNGKHAFLVVGLSTRGVLNTAKLGGKLRTTQAVQKFALPALKSMYKGGLFDDASVDEYGVMVTYGTLDYTLDRVGKITDLIGESVILLAPKDVLQSFVDGSITAGEFVQQSKVLTSGRSVGVPFKPMKVELK